MDSIPLAADKSKMFSIGRLKFLDSYNFLATPLDQMAKIYGCKTKTLYPYEHYGLDYYDSLIDNLNIEDFRPLLSNKLPTQEEVDNFDMDNSPKNGKDLTVEYLENDVEKLDYCMNEAANLSMKEFSLNPLLYVCLPGYSFDWWLMTSGFILGTFLDKQMLDNFVEAKRGGICGKMGDRYINKSDDNGNGSGSGNGNGNGNGGGNSKITDNSNRSIWYIDANNLYGYAMI